MSTKFDAKKVSLGKKKYEHDDRTLMMADYLKLPDVRIPSKFNFDKNRKPIPFPEWGNDKYGDCVIAGEANHILRLERVEQRGTVKISNEDAINRYKHLTGCSSPGDANDKGLVVLEAMRDWRSNGFQSTSEAAKGKNYSIAAYGELDPHNRAQMRAAIYLLHGVHMGFWLPNAAANMTYQGVWHYEGQNGPDWQPGSWGGHLVYSKAYDEDSYEILTWGMKVKVTNAFAERYCDEAWAVVDSLDSWRLTHYFDVEKVKQRLSEITTKVNT